MTFVDIGPGCFTDERAFCISYKGANYYRACNAPVAEHLTGRSFCVKLEGHAGVAHEDFDGRMVSYGDIVTETAPRPPSNLVAHARRELEIVGEEPQTIEGICKVIQAFADMGHSGGSASVVIPWINTLLNFTNLTPLTDDPTEWIYHDEMTWGQPGGIWQNIRNGNAFSTDGGQSYRMNEEKGWSTVQYSKRRKVKDEDILERPDELQAKAGGVTPE